MYSEDVRRHKDTLFIPNSNAEFSQLIESFNEGSNNAWEGCWITEIGIGIETEGTVTVAGANGSGKSRLLNSIENAFKRQKNLASPWGTTFLLANAEPLIAEEIIQHSNLSAEISDDRARSKLEMFAQLNAFLAVIPPAIPAQMYGEGNTNFDLHSSTYEYLESLCTLANWKPRFARIQERGLDWPDLLLSRLTDFEMSSKSYSSVIDSSWLATQAMVGEHYLNSMMAIVQSLVLEPTANGVTVWSKFKASETANLKFINKSVQEMIQNVIALREQSHLPKDCYMRGVATAMVPRDWFVEETAPEFILFQESVFLPVLRFPLDKSDMLLREFGCEFEPINILDKTDTPNIVADLVDQLSGELTRRILPPLVAMSNPEITNPENKLLWWDRDFNVASAKFYPIPPANEGGLQVDLDPKLNWVLELLSTFLTDFVPDFISQNYDLLIGWKKRQGKYTSISELKEPILNLYLEPKLTEQAELDAASHVVYSFDGKEHRVVSVSDLGLGESIWVFQAINLIHKLRSTLVFVWSELPISEIRPDSEIFATFQSGIDSVSLPKLLKLRLRDSSVLAGEPEPKAQSILFLDEPERNLHFDAKLSVGRWIAKVSALGVSVFVATHEILILDLPTPNVQRLFIERWNDKRPYPVITRKSIDVSQMSDLQRFGVNPVSALLTTKTWLILEGRVDLAIIQTWFARILADKGVSVIVSSGTSNQPHLMELQMFSSVAKKIAILWDASTKENDTRSTRLAREISKIGAEAHLEHYGDPDFRERRISLATHNRTDIFMQLPFESVMAYFETLSAKQGGTRSINVIHQWSDWDDFLAKFKLHSESCDCKLQARMNSIEHLKHFFFLNTGFRWTSLHARNIASRSEPPNEFCQILENLLSASGVTWEEFFKHPKSAYIN